MFSKIKILIVLVSSLLFFAHVVSAQEVSKDSAAIEDTGMDETSRRAWLEREYPLYVAKYGFILFSEFEAEYAGRYEASRNSDWFPGANCDDSNITDDYCGEYTYWGDFSSVFQDGELLDLPSCPGLAKVYEGLVLSHPETRLEKLLDTLLATSEADSELRLVVQQEGITLRAVCVPIASGYDQLISEMKAEGLTEPVMSLEQFAVERLGHYLEDLFQ
jgi:hypothetical protein